MPKKIQQYLLKLARQTLEHHFHTGSKLLVAESDLPQEFLPELKQKRGVFVTLHKDNDLRGCIGSLTPEKALYQAVIDNAIASGFADRRFSPLGHDELINITIEISVLTPAQKLKYTTAKDLLLQLKPKKDGVIIEHDGLSATYLPQVWEILPKKEEFLNSLCEKAGMEAGEWKNGKLSVFTYQAEVFGE